MNALLVLMALVLPPVSRGEPARECVVLLHGLARSAGSMAKLARALEQGGYGVANIDYPSRSLPIEGLAPLAVERGLAQCRDQGATTIHFVTHSLGGILVRQYLATTTVRELGRVVMLGPPNQGSEVVDRFSRLPGYGAINGPAGSQLGTTPGNVPPALGPVTYPVGVIAGTRSVNPILSTAIPGKNDGKVSVERARVDGMADFIEVASAHPFLMRNDEAIRQVMAFLKEGRFAR